MTLTIRERSALNNIKTMCKNGFSLEKIKRKLEPKYSSSERKKALEEFLFQNVNL